MDESSGKGSSGGGGKGKQKACTKDTSTQQKEASSIYVEYENICKRMEPYRMSYIDIEGTHRRLEQVEQLLKDNDVEREELAKEKDAIIQERDTRIRFLEQKEEEDLDKFQRRYAVFDKEREEFKGKVEAAKIEVRQKLGADVEKWRQLLEEEQANTGLLQQRLGKLERDKRNVDKKLQGWEVNLRVLEKVNFQEFDAEVVKISECYVDIFRKYFLVDLPDNLVADHDNWEAMPSLLGVDLPLPPSNTDAAKQIRMITALHILSSLLCDIVLAPSYIPESDFAARAIKEILDDQYHADEKKERMVRRLILSVYETQEVNEAGERAVSAIVGKAKDYFKFLVADIEGFIGDLKGVLGELMELWKRAQKSEKMVLASVESVEDEDDDEWDYLPEFGTFPRSPEDPKPNANTKLFPRIFVPDDHIIHNGIVLWPTQQILIDAQIEFQEFKEAQQLKRQEAEQLLKSQQGSFKSKLSNMFPGRTRRQLSLGGQGMRSQPTSPQMNGDDLLPWQGEQRVQGSAVSSGSHGEEG